MKGRELVVLHCLPTIFNEALLKLVLSQLKACKHALDLVRAGLGATQDPQGLAVLPLLEPGLERGSLANNVTCFLRRVLW